MNKLKKWMKKTVDLLSALDEAHFYDETEALRDQVSRLRDRIDAIESQKSKNRT